MTATYEVIETGRFRISITDEDGNSASSKWTSDDRVAFVYLAGSIYLAVSLSSPFPLPGGKVFEAREVPETVVSRIGVDT